MKRLLDQWRELKEGNNTWLLKSRDAAQASLISGESKQIFRNLTEVKPFATVFGPPQVGKTALILSLLGISSARLNELGQILRATIKGGNSSTSTSFIYKRSADTKFHISSPDLDLESSLDASELIQSLRRIRDEIKNNRIFKTPVTICIPIDYFESGAEELSIIDIPGIESKTSYESANLSATLVNFVSMSSFIFIVQKVAHVTGVGSLEIPLLGNWKSHTSKVALVLTHGFSSNSTRQKLNANNGCISDEIVSSLNKRCISGLGLPEGASLSVYRVDLADSLLCHPYREEIEKYNSKLFKEMRREVRERRFLQSFSMDPIQDISSQIQKAAIEEKRRLSEESASLQISRMRKDEELANWRSAEKIYKEAIDELKLPVFPEFSSFLSKKDLELKEIKNEDKGFVYDNYNSLYLKAKAHLQKCDRYRKLPSSLRQGFERQLQIQSHAFKQNAIKSIWSDSESVYKKYLAKVDEILEKLSETYDSEVESYEALIDSSAAEKKTALKAKRKEALKLIKEAESLQNSQTLRLSTIQELMATVEETSSRELHALDQNQIQYLLNLRMEIHLNLSAFKTESVKSRKVLLFMLLFKQISQYKDIYERSQAKALRHSA